MAKFKTRARAIDMLGRQQIANISTAISELFKNSYDAYADSIEADYFRYDNLFVLRDDGFGMTEEEFTNRWLAVGTESKHEEGDMKQIPPPKGKELRPMMGEKGIGRLAISTIGSQVLILSRAEREGSLFPTVAAFINWRIFESPGIDLDQIFIPVESYPTGTLPSQEEVLVLVEMFRDNVKNFEKQIPERLKKDILEDLDQFDFDPIQIDAYLSDLSLKESNKKNKLSLREDKTGTHFYILPASDQLASEIDEEPEGGGSAPLIKTLIGFTNSMKLPSEENKSENSEKLQSEPLEPALGIRTAFRDHKKEDLYDDLINTQNFFTLEDFRRTDHFVEGVFDEEGNFNGMVRIYEQESINHTISKPRGMTGQTKCGSFRIKFGYVQGAKAESSLPENEFNDISSKLDKIGGLYVYKDGIRVQPYGSYDIDYLGLEVRRSKGAAYYFFSYRRIFGYIEVSRKNNPQLAEKAGREGFIDNDAYKQFRRILVNLFLQLAADFFRAQGRNLGAYQETKAELQKQHQILRERQEATNEATTKFRRDLNDFIGKLDGKIPSQEANRIVEDFSESVDLLKKNLLPEEFTSKLLKLESEYRNKLKNIRDRYHLVKPEIGLDEKLRKSWEYYRDTFAAFEKKVINEARAGISHIAQSALKTKNITSPVRKWALENTQTRLKEESDSLKKRTIETKNSVTRLSSEIDRINKTFQEESKKLEENLRSKLIQGKEETFHEAFVDFDDELKEASEEKILLLTNLRDRVTELEKFLQRNDAQYTLTETIAALEEENINLRVRYDESVELAQLGMAVSVIGHEFSHTINDIRTSLRRLGNWADQNPELNDLYNSLRQGFDHLDEYLRMFTPLQRRLYRREVEITGGQIATYLRQVFSQALEENDIDLVSSDSFSEAVLIGYPSTFYPVFINLVDNAIYWLKDHPRPRAIRMDAKRDGTIIVSDTGPGIHPIDREAVFESGFTRKPGGRGLGLKISQEVLNKAGYQISLDGSSKESGAMFLIKHITEE